MSANADVMAVTKEMRERHVARRFTSPTLVAWADRIDAAVAQREAKVAELIAASKGLKEAEWVVTHDWGGDREAVMKRLDAALAAMGAK